MKEIKLSIEGGMGDHITLLSLANVTNLTIQTQSLTNSTELLKENCKIEVTENPTTKAESIKTYGDPRFQCRKINGKEYISTTESEAKRSHQAVYFLKAFGVYDEKVELVPRMNFTKKEDEYGRAYISHFKKPTLCFCPAADPNSPTRNLLSFVSSRIVEAALDFFEEYFTVVYISNHVDLRCWRPTFITLSASNLYSIRNIAAILKHADGYFGTDTGLTHLAVAAGCKSFVWHHRMEGIYYDQNFRNYGYTKDMWRNDECVVFNYDETNSRHLLDDLLRECILNNPKFKK